MLCGQRRGRCGDKYGAVRSVAFQIDSLVLLFELSDTPEYTSVLASERAASKS